MEWLACRAMTFIKAVRYSNQLHKAQEEHRCINFIEYKQLATVRFNSIASKHETLIAECVSKRREHGLLDCDSKA